MNYLGSEIYCQQNVKKIIRTLLIQSKKTTLYLLDTLKMSIQIVIHSSILQTDNL